MPAADAISTEAMLHGRYRLGECLGEGGMARVVRADDVVLGRAVAVKLFRSDVEAASTSRARAEVATLAALNHPGLVTVFDAHLSAPPAFMVMELVSGPTLAQLLSGSGLEPDAVAGLTGELAEALHVVHRAGVVHRDVKPSNVLMCDPSLPGGRHRAKLADFGIARLVDATRVTAPGMVLGTAAYAAPEQVRGLEPSPASDIYSLGLVLLEALTGTRAYPQREALASALARLEAPPVIPTAFGAAWAELLEAMTRTDPRLRPCAAEVVDRVSTLPVGSTGGAVAPTAAAATAATVFDQTAPATVAAAPSETDVSPTRSGRRRRSSLRRAVVAGVMAAAVAGLGGAAGIWITGAMTPPAQVSTVQEIPVTPPPTDDATAEEPPAIVPAGVAGGSSDAVPAPESAGDEPTTRQADAPEPAPSGGQSRREENQGQDEEQRERDQERAEEQREQAQERAQEQRERAQERREQAEEQRERDAEAREESDE